MSPNIDYIWAKLPKKMYKNKGKLSKVRETTMLLTKISHALPQKMWNVQKENRVQRPKKAFNIINHSSLMQLLKHVLLYHQIITLRDPHVVVYGFLFLCDYISISHRAGSHEPHLGQSPFSLIIINYERWSSLLFLFLLLSLYLYLVCTIQFRVWGTFPYLPQLVSKIRTLIH